VGFADARLVVAFLDDVTFVALLARALPAGERLVAGFNRVVLATRFRAAPAFAAERVDERDESLFSGLLILICAGTLKVPKRRLFRGGA
jgi:hypothetical protein